MKIRTLLIAGTVAVSVGIGTHEHLSSKKVNEKTLSPLILANIKALSMEEDSDTKCPDHNYVPNHYIVTSHDEYNVTCTTDGEITFKGETFQGGYEKNKSYAFVVITYNCDGKEKGACCDQRDVRTEIEEV